MTTYFLLAAAAVVWGLIVYRVLQAVNGNDDVVYRKEEVFNNSKGANVDTDTFSISLNYSDPFFSKVSAGASNYNYSNNTYSNTAGNGSNNDAERRAGAGNSNSTPKSSKTAKAKTTPDPVVAAIDWSFIAFNGLIKNAQTNTLVALIIIHQKGHMMKEGDVYDGVKLNKAYKDSVVVEYSNEKKTIKRK